MEVETNTEALQIVVDFCHNYLACDETVEAYLRRRFINEDTVRLFKIGAWPANPYIIKKNVDPAVLRAARLFWTDDNTNKEVCKFENHRLLIPVHDPHGKLIAITGRSLHSAAKQSKLGIPKYTGTKHSKRTTLFGLNSAKDAIREKNKVMVVEGNLDVVKARQHGMNAVVAMTGSTLTAEQVVQLSRYTNNIVLCFDNDEAGQKGSRKALRFARSGISIVEKRLPGAKDLDEYLDNKYNKK